MKVYNGYDRINDFMKYSQNVVFNKQLEYEGKEILVNGEKTKGIIRNDQNPMSETKEDRSLIVGLDVFLQRGNYIEYNKSIHMIMTKVDEESFYKKCKIRECNQTLNCKGQSKPIPCIADNTTYGVKGIKDNGYFIEVDARLKLMVQKNKETDRYYEGMRFIFNNKTAYQVTKVDDVVLNGIYVLETMLVPLSPLDDLENNIAYNEKFENEKPSEDYEILGVDKIRVGNTEEYKINPENSNIAYELDEDIHAQILEQSDGICKIKGLKSNGIVTLSAKLGQDVVSTKDIIIY